MRLTSKLTAIALSLSASLAAAQSNLGELLDAGGKPMSAEEIRQELVQRIVVGPTATGAHMELMYAPTGLIAGKGNHPMAGTGNTLIDVAGDWKLDDRGRFCSTVRQAGWGLGTSGGISRCQFWFKYKEQYFLADSDTDRQARVLLRTVKQ